MSYHRQHDVFPAENSVAPAAGSVPQKSTVVLIGWPVVLIGSSLILYRTGGAFPMPPFLDVFVIFYALSNGDCISSMNRRFVISSLTSRW